MAKSIKKVEAWVKRIDLNEYQFLFRDSETNKTVYESTLYTRRTTAKLGGIRHAKKNGYKIAKWLK